MAADLFEVFIGNTSIGAGNLAINTFHQQPAGAPTVAESVAQLIAFCCYGSKAANTYFDSVRWTPIGAAGSVPIAWPTAELAALGANDASLPALTGYGDTFGSGALTPIGTSITLSKYSGTPGRSATGRDYLPFIGVGAVEADGSLKVAARTAVQDAWQVYSRGIATGAVVVPPADFQEVVDGVGGPYGLLVSKASPILSNLDSRRR